MITEIIHKLNDAEQQRRYEPRPSLAGPERCIRSLVMQGLGIPASPLPGRSLMVMDDSSWHEELTKDVLRKSAYAVHSEQMEVFLVDPETNISLKGHIDWLMTGLDGQDLLIEHKAINHFTFEKFERAEDLPMDYLTQSALYFRGLQRINPDITSGLLLVKNKNTSAYLEYTLHYAGDGDVLSVDEMHTTRNPGEPTVVAKEFPGITRAAFDKFAEIRALIKDKRLPKRPYTPDDWHCQYCQYHQECYKNYEAEFEALAADVALDDETDTLAGFYNQLGAQISELQKERDERKADILSKLRERDIRSGRSAGYIIELTRMPRKGFVVQDSIVEKLTVKKIKPPKEGKR